MVRPAGDAGHAHGSFTRAVTPAFVGQVAALRRIALRGAVVGGPDDECFFIQRQALQGGKNLTHRPVKLLDTVTPMAVGGFTFESGAGIWIAGAAGHGMGQVKEERFFPTGLDETNRLFGVAPGQVVAIHGGFDNLFITHQRQLGPFFRALVARHVIAVGNAEEGVETLARG